ncbi:DUF4145 domain-containing protein [Terrisporobacter glycolicus]|uniref:DUF4145 domain-containing protein n=1 Tax=Terrisporobacter glycolicus ATCC 14880 = DSM 1288 TaxID=1121315 RepID=A0ABZ2EW41_9FIRM|nr:DUF4145 domain-containing protein [Terrisporobacter glycolicus]
MDWKETIHLECKNYICGYCGLNVGNDRGFHTDERIGMLGGSYREYNIYICPKCNKPTFFDDKEKQYPGVKIGSNIQNITHEEVVDLYKEARNCFSVDAFTSVALCCRKLLMNISVNLGANENESFFYYVNWLDKNMYIPPNSKGWVDQIRKIGNNATHEINIISKEDAEKTMKFIEMLLKIVYELPAMLNNQEEF